MLQIVIIYHKKIIILKKTLYHLIAFSVQTNYSHIKFLSATLFRYLISLCVTEV